jgi:hypothetical protein
MRIKSGGFPLLKLRIAKNEYLPGYMLNQILYGARGKAQSAFLDQTSDIRNFSWRTINDVQDLVQRSDLALPSLDECIMGHTLFPYYSWCLSEKDAAKLYEQYAYPNAGPEIEKKRGFKQGDIRGSVPKSRSGLMWCPQCVSSQISGSNSLLFPVWHRLHFAAHILVCHLHKTPLTTFCDVCIDKSGMDRRNWIPTLECLCPNKLKVRAAMSEKMLGAISSITSKAHDILERQIPPEFTPFAIKQAIKKKFRGNSSEPSQVSKILTSVSECIGEEAAELLEFNENTVNSFISGNGVPRRKNPIHILTFGYASFNGFEGLMETINGSTKWIPERPARPPTKYGPYRHNSQTRPKREEIEKLVTEMSIAERDELKQKGRAWLLDRLKKHPGLTRLEFWRRHGLRNIHSNYLVWMDTDWFHKQIPSAAENLLKKKLTERFGASTEITAEIVYERRTQSIQENPLKKITQRLLMRPLDGPAIISVQRLNPELREAIRNCVDDSNTWQLRAARTLSKMISENFPTHPYADLNWYLGLDSRNFSIRFHNAKKWFFNHKNQH